MRSNWRVSDTARLFGQEANVSATIVRQAARTNLRLVADHGRIIPDPRGAVRTCPRAAPVVSRAPAREPREGIPRRRVAPASVRITRRGRLAVTVGVILVMTAISMVLAVRV
jgi:hypothetical protein